MGLEKMGISSIFLPFFSHFPPFFAYSGNCSEIFHPDPLMAPHFPPYFLLCPHFPPFLIFSLFSRLQIPGLVSW